MGMIRFDWLLLCLGLATIPLARSEVTRDCIEALVVRVVMKKSCNLEMLLPTQLERIMKYDYTDTPNNKPDYNLVFEVSSRRDAATKELLKSKCKNSLAPYKRNRKAKCNNGKTNLTKKARKFFKREAAEQMMDFYEEKHLEHKHQKNSVTAIKKWAESKRTVKDKEELKVALHKANIESIAFEYKMLETCVDVLYVKATGKKVE